MGLRLRVICQLINLCTIAVVLVVPGSSGSILQSPALSPSIKSPLLDRSIKGPLPSLSPGQSTTLLPEHGLTTSVPGQPLHSSAPSITAETPYAEPHVLTIRPAAELPLVSSQPPAAAYSSNGSSLTPASDAPSALAPPLALKPPEGTPPLSNAQSSSSLPLIVPLPPQQPPFCPSPSDSDEHPHTSSPLLTAVPSNPVAPLLVVEPPKAVNVPPSSEVQPVFPSPPTAMVPNLPPATTMQSPISPNVSPALPQQVPSNASPLPPRQEAPPIIPSLLPAVAPYASVFPSPPFPSSASSPLSQWWGLPHVSPPPLPQKAPPITPSTLPSLPPHASVMPSPLAQQAPSHASPLPLPQEAPPIILLPLPAVPPHATVMPSPPLLSNASSPLPPQAPSQALPQEAPPIIPSPLPAAPPHDSVIPSLPSSSNASSPLPQMFPSGPPPNFTVPSHAFVPPPLMVPLPQEPPSSFPSPPPAVPPYASTLQPPPVPQNASSPSPHPVPLHLVPPKSPLNPVPRKSITPPHLVPPPLMKPLPPEPPAILLSPPPSVPPPASAIPFPPLPPHGSSPPLQLVPSRVSPPTFEVPSHALAPPPLTIPLPKEPPSILAEPPLTMPPHSSTMQPPLMPPHRSSPSPQASPTTSLVPPPLTRPPRTFSLLPPPTELPQTFPPRSTTLPGPMPAPAFVPPAVSPPLAPAPLVVSSLPFEKLHSYVPPSPTIQGVVPALSPHASQRDETQNVVPPPVPASLEPSPSSRISPRMPRSEPPFSHQIEIPSGAPFWRSNVSVPPQPPLSSPAPSNIISDGVPLAAPPSNNTISNRVPSAAPPGSVSSMAPPPFSSLVHPPSIGSPHRSPVKGISPFISPYTPIFVRPSNLAPIPAALSPKSSSEGSHSSAVSPSPSIHNYLRDEARSPAPASVLVPPPASSRQGQVESPSPLYAPEPSLVAGQKYNPSSPPSQVAVVPSSSRSRVPEISPVPSKIPFLSPKISPSGSSTRNTKRPLAPPIRALPPPPPNQDCAYLTCQEPLTNTPPGSPCGCVWPMQVGLHLSVALYTFFPLVSELARNIAAGVSMNQSQVRIMEASAAPLEPEKTIVLIDLVPLHDKFDYSTAMLTSLRFWHKQVPIDKSIFGDYDVLYVHYPGLPPSPPISPDEAAVINSMPYSLRDPNGSKLHPLGVDVPKKRYQHKLSGSVIAVIVFLVVTVVLICGLVSWVLISRHVRRGSQSAQMPRAVPSFARSSGHTGHSNGSGLSSPLSLGSSLAAYTGSARTFSASEIEKATDNFNPSGILGEGGFGCVYHGILENGTSVAAKLLKRDDQQGGREFLAEVEMLSRLHHRNLVKLIGICIDERMRCLVYELVPNGSVDSHLHGADKETAPLDWASRLKIALGAARGLAYLHEDSSPRVIHRDFKSSNILLENDFTPKVSDFGLARTALDEENRHISTRVMGTFGYVAPEYAMTGHLLVKSDVYSYGVVLLELLTGRKPVDMSQPPGQENLVAWTRPLLTAKEGLESIIDPSLGPNVPYESVAKVAAIASMCVQPEVSHRPFMGEVVQALKLVCNECDDSRDGEDSRSLSHENLSIDFDAKASTSPLAGETPDPLRAQFSLHGFPPGHDLEKGLSVSEIFSVSARVGRQTSGSLQRHSASGPIKTSRGPRFWQKIRRMSQGSVSEHGIMYRSWAGPH